MPQEHMVKGKQRDEEEAELNHKGLIEFCPGTLWEGDRQSEETNQGQREDPYTASEAENPVLSEGQAWPEANDQTSQNQLGEQGEKFSRNGEIVPQGCLPEDENLSSSNEKCSARNIEQPREKR